MKREAPLAAQLYALPPRPEDVRSEDVLDRFLAFVKERGFELYSAQEEALLEIIAGKNVILSTPTGSGKSLVATAMHFLSLAGRRRSIYTCPIKALVSEKFFALCEDFGPEYVGMMTGDATVNRDAPILCCTAEILANMALAEGAATDVDHVVMDEFHYYADRDRGVAWQIPLLALPRARFLLMSATLGPTERFEERLTRLTGAETVTVRGKERPVPLEFEYRQTALHETLKDLVNAGEAPVYVVSFTQRGAAEQAQNLLSVDFSSKDEKKAIAEALKGVRFDSPYGKELSRLIRHGVGLHHAGLLPKYRRTVERLAQKGQLKVISGTDTLGVGVNVPIRTVLLTQLCKFDGEKTALLSARDFHQISGRAGRRGFDVKGRVVVQAPEHVIENLKLEQKAGLDPSRKKKFVRKKPPEKGYVHWDRATFDRLVVAEPEPLVSRFAVTHGMLLQVLSRPRGGCRAMSRLIGDSDERRAQKRLLGRTASAMYRSLLEAGIVYLEEGRPVVNADLQEDFSLNHALSMYLLHATTLLDPETETYALDLLTLVESILENPDFVLRRQLDAIKTRKLAELKAAGVEYDERMAELEKLDYPKPNKDFVYDTFNAFARKHPWLAAENIRPKSIAREMFESFLSFPDYVKDYGLERGEGLLLRYLTDVYKTLVKSVPTLARTADVEDVITYFGAIVRAADSSLLDEWERMRSGEEGIVTPVASPLETPGDADVTRNVKEFMVLVRNAAFAVVRALARRDHAAAVALVEPAEWSTESLAAAMAPYWERHAAIRLDPKARGVASLLVKSQGPEAWELEQLLLDPEDENDWALALRVDVGRSRTEGRAVLVLGSVLS